MTSIEAITTDPVYFSVAPGYASESLKDFAIQAGVDIVFDSRKVQGVQTKGVEGNLLPRFALERLLQGTGLVFKEDLSTGAFAITRQAVAAIEPKTNKPNATQSMNNINNSPATGKTNPRNVITKFFNGFVTVVVVATVPVTAQQNSTDEEAIFELSPFEVSADQDVGYLATTTLAGTRLRTDLSDIGTAVSVLTEEFLQDVAGTDNETVLTYATNMEVGGLSGNYQNAPNTGSWGQTAETASHFAPNSNTRVRGLTSADNTRNYFRTNVAWDSYNVSRIDLLRGPNSILFGLGSPGGVINATTDSADPTRNFGEVSLSIDEFGSFRATGMYNLAAIPDTLGVQIALLNDNQQYQQNPAYDDEERVYAALRYRPEGLNKGNMTFEITADYETGEGTSNRPRTAPPLDYLTPWIEPVSTMPIKLPAGSNFNGYSDGVIPAYTLFADQAGVTFQEVVTRSFPNSIGLWADAFGPRLNVNSYEAFGPDFWRQGRVWVEGVRLANGTQYYGNPQSNRQLYGYGNAFQDVPVQTLPRYLVAAGHPFGNSFQPLQFTDPSVFDFYNNLLDGPNKMEWNDFDQARIVLSGSFLNRKLGYEFSYFSEQSTRGQTTYLSDVARIFVDTALETIEDNPALGTSPSVNPNFGRPYVQETTAAGNRQNEYDVEGMRFSVYFEHDFVDEGKNSSSWRSLLGRHILNAAYSEDDSTVDQRSFRRFVLGPEFVAQSPNNPLFNNRTNVSVRYYIGESLVGRSSVSGSSVGNLERYVIPSGGTIDLRYFDTTWNADPSVNPATRWTNPRGQNWEEASNPANYVGWTNAPFTIIDALSGNQADMDLATGSAALFNSVVDSKILTWQGNMLNGLLVGTIGWREDKSNSLEYRADTNPSPYNNANVSPEVYSLSNPATLSNSLTVRSNNYSAVVHLNRLRILENLLPLKVSLSYNQGENFNPTAARRDITGAFMPAPKGETEEYGILLSTNDNRYVLRIMKFETSVLNTTTSTIRDNFRFNQFLSLNPRDLINDIEEGLLRETYNAYATQPSWSIDDQENISAPAWRKFEQDFAAAFPGFIDAWLVEGTFPDMNRSALFSPNYVNIEDNVSKGWEIEFTANPTSQLRLTLNASRTEASRSNVPGPATKAVYEFIQNAMVDANGNPTAAGAMRSGYDTLNDTMADFWQETNWVNYLVIQQLNGQPAPELVEWRVNALANYRFADGFLDGFRLGGAIRYESGVSVGFPYYFDDNGEPTADIKNPFKRGSDERFDLWLGYNRKLSNGKVDWSIQLNIYNIFGDDELIPVRANPDGTIANFRIQQGATWRLSTTFGF